MESTNGHETLHAGHVEIRPGENAALVQGRPLTLTVRELQLQTALAERAGRIVARDELYSVVWSGELRSADRSVDVYVSKLRAKLELALPRWRYIHTLRVRLPVLAGAPRPAHQGTSPLTALSHPFHILLTAR